MDISRRHFFRTAGTVALGFYGLRSLLNNSAPSQAAAARPTGYGALLPDSAKLLDLPEGFSYRVISRLGDRMDDGLLVPGRADGMAAFAGPGGKTLLIRNHEIDPDNMAEGPFGPRNELLSRVAPSLLYDNGKRQAPGLGGTTTLVYDTKVGKLERQFLSLAGTHRNCAGGPTPWNSWISCEETVTRAGGTNEQDHGYNFEVPAAMTARPVSPVPLKAMGRFNHEAVAVDPRSGVVYQTEDRNDGLIYRFIPRTPERLADGGRLQALQVKGVPGLDSRNWNDNVTMAPGQSVDVEWIDLAEIDSPNDDLRLRGFAQGAARFARGEGMWYGRDAVYFACTNGGAAKKGQIWRYVPSLVEGRPGEKMSPGRLELFVEPNDGKIVENADNLTLAPWGDLIVCEDGDDEQFIVGVTPQGQFYKLARNAKSTSEFAGACFSPDGSTLFVNIQKNGLTLAITGPWQT